MKTSVWHDSVARLRGPVATKQTRAALAARLVIIIPCAGLPCPLRRCLRHALAVPQVWDINTGDNYTSIEPEEGDINDVAVWPDSGACACGRVLDGGWARAAAPVSRMLPKRDRTSTARVPCVRSCLGFARA